MFFVYIIRNNSNKLYIGISKNPISRLNSHNTKTGAEFTKSGRYNIVFQEEYKNLKEARQREIQIKKWRREKKNVLIKRYLSGLPTNLAR